MQNLTNNNDNEDRISSLKVLELKNICQCYRLKVFGNKDNLIARVTEHAKTLESTAFDDNDGNRIMIDHCIDGCGFEDTCRKHTGLACSLFCVSCLIYFTKLE